MKLKSILLIVIFKKIFLLNIKLFFVKHLACQNIVCQNGGKCQTNNGVYCQCQNNYYGNRCQFQSLNSTRFKESSILTEELGNKLVNLLTVSNSVSFSKIYQATRNGFTASRFHSYCNNQPNTFIVIKSDKLSIFGGYTEANWMGFQYKFDSNAFLFSLNNSYNRTPIILDLIEPYNAIFADHNSGPVFGRADLRINDLGISNLGFSYKLPFNLAKIPKDALHFLAGSNPIIPLEIEAYTIEGEYIFLYYYY